MAGSAVSQLVYLLDEAFEGTDWHSLLGNLHTIAQATSWLQEGQQRLRASIVTLSDAELLRPRLTSWDELKETRWIRRAFTKSAGQIQNLSTCPHESA